MKRTWFVVFILLAVLVQARFVSAEEVSLPELFTIRNINVKYVAVRLTERAGALRVGKAAQWSSTCRNFGSLTGDDFCWRAGRQRLRIPLPEFGWAAYELVRPRVLWNFGQIDVRWPPGLIYDGEIKGGLTLRQRGRDTSVALEVRF